MMLQVFHWGWGYHTLSQLDPNETETVSKLVKSYKVSGVIGIRFNPVNNLIVVMLDNRAGYQTEKSILSELSHDFDGADLSRSVCVAVSGHAGVPHAFWAFNPASEEWEYLDRDPIVLDSRGRNAFAPDERAVPAESRKRKGYRPFHEPRGLSPKPRNLD